MPASARTPRSRAKGAAPAKRAPAPDVAAPKVKGFAVLTAKSDAGSWFDIEIRRDLEDVADRAAADPLVHVTLNRTFARLMGDPDQPCCDYIDDIRASDLDALVEELRAAIEVARRYGVIPPADPEHRWWKRPGPDAAVEG